MLAGDFVLGVFALGLVSAVLFWCGIIAVRRTPRWIAVGIGLVTLTVTVVFSVTLHGRLALARVLPFSNAIVIGNWIPLGTALLTGITACLPTIPRWRRFGVSGMLATVAWYSVGYDLFAPSPQPRLPHFLDGVCMQTTAASCSACSAAMLLMHHQISASESELMALCLTRTGGTPELGLYRGLKLKTQHTKWDVEILSTDLQGLRWSGSFPVLLFVELNEDGADRPSGCWNVRRTNHAVVVYGFARDGSVDVADPSCGRMRWSVDTLSRRWSGRGLRLVASEEPRTPTSEENF